MKSGREVFDVWAPEESIWSPWVSPVMFAQISCAEHLVPTSAERPSVIWYEEQADRETAIVLDLPGSDAIHSALGLATLGYRPVPVINASPGPIRLQLTPAAPSVVTLDMEAIVRSVCMGTSIVSETPLAPEAAPVFILDSRRTAGSTALRPELFDNRWTIFPQDFPSARFLLERGIKRVVLVHTNANAQPQEDLAHVLLRWQEAGLEIFGKVQGNTEVPVKITVTRPSRFRLVWHRALVLLGFRRSSVGGFGAFLAQGSGGG
jgi:hypothetical protein